MSNMKPVGTRIIASQIDKGNTELPSGLVMPDTAKGDELVAYKVESVSAMVAESKQFAVGMHVYIPRATPTARINEGTPYEYDLFDIQYIVAKLVPEE